MATGQQIIAECKILLGEGLGANAQVQSTLYPRHVRTVADRIARQTSSFYRTAVCDILNGQVAYVLPSKPYRDCTITVTDNWGNIWPIKTITPTEADERFFNWRSPTTLTNYQGIPRYAIAEGATTYKFLPVPNYAQIDGLQIGGYYGIDQWTWDMEQECPLQTGIEECLTNGVLYLRCKEMQVIDPKYKVNMAQYENDYKEQLRRLWRECLDVTESRRSGLVPDRNNRTWWGTGWTAF